MKALLLSICILMGYISVSIAMTVNINLTWDLNQNYNVQEGSIVQIVAYRTGNGSNPTGDADDNFTTLLAEKARMALAT